MKKNQLSKTISTVLAGSVLCIGSISSASAHVMYNTYNSGAATGTGGTDGWNLSTLESWVGTGGTGSQIIGTTSNGSDITNVLPLGFVGKQALNWAAMVHSTSDSLIVSRAHAQTTYGLDADIDTAKGAWSDGTQGWAHNTDYGLIKSMVDTKITLSLSNVTDNSWSNFGITLFTGMDTGAAGYNHHATWNKPVNTLSAPFDNSVPYSKSNPHATDGVIYKDHSFTSTIDFIAVAGQVYSIYLGGNDGAGNFGPHADYQLTIDASPVPVPAAAWLLGSGLIGLFSYGRRKNAVALND